MSELEMKKLLLGEEIKFGIDWIHPCALHGEDEGWYRDDEAIPSCPECGCMLETEDCIWGCGANWLSYGTNTFDDVMRSAAVNIYGDVMCARCLIEEEIEEEDEYSGDWEDDYP